ncbi:hypothetical protein K458DRAFT_384758 [Lentithecium fluviatile CBS 122367]|uniref:Uncharacterized protein n=1 Tax=Lentithecium fluviatile CBS 122367 TaxID=1168545 RepID=A0A6G1JDL8_9PLEO|nr:hypothetical protein K458DRAFT_384758 [Lentithecium fluviatile CBS 122367]
MWEIVGAITTAAATKLSGPPAPPITALSGRSCLTALLRASAKPRMRLCQSQRRVGVLTADLASHVRHFASPPIGSADLCTGVLEPQLQQRRPAQTPSASLDCLDASLFVSPPHAPGNAHEPHRGRSPATLPNSPSCHSGLGASRIASGLV